MTVLLEQESAARRATPSSIFGTSSIFGWIMVLPALSLFALFILVPFIQTLVYSLYKFGLTSPTKQFVGFSHYLEIVQDDVFWIAFENNIIIAITGIILQIGVGLLLAAILDRGIKRGKSVISAIIFMPIVISTIAIGLLWRLVFDPNTGMIEELFFNMGWSTPMRGWLGDPDIALYAIIFVGFWQYTGFMMIILLAAMQGIPRELYEAAKLDGAGPILSFFNVTLPELRNVLIVCVLITVISAFKVFDLVYVLTSGGPGNSTQVMGSYIVQNAFTIGRMGYANAVSVVLLVIALGLGIVQLRTSRRDR
ncbi:carbohydrate ABC transporter membrane protein 1, CUT1 family [Pseudovibrio denitrificans]|uniref:Carbohydrate ABC transporter membrane protein 1, CUT1 family n=1 Tax=Pseudovibrio denitrificans TaxID=258256 RepID=A0A1I7D1R8_9HYPH|nr:sugar ABC transporter permease [Pseudovibrio denitrificans]SFU05635.1 carbohydrate ABC transporter membrane protein 1, CUT1 family [Pseudovibrio denitrificans]